MFRHDREYRTVAPRGNTLHVSSGTAAIALALDDCGVTAGNEVLVSAYNCRSMREAVWLHGATDVLYSVNPDLSIDTEDIVRRITEKTRAILVPHFFGFPQELEPIRRICDEYEIKLIEDCAHTLIRSLRDSRVGQLGDYVIGSATKFFPVDDGGFLVIAGPGDKVRLEPQSLPRELRSAWNAVEIAIGYRRLPAIGFFFRPLYALRRKLKTPPSSSKTGDAGSAMPAPMYFRQSTCRQPMTRVARTTVRCYSVDNAARLRQRNYRILAEACSNLRAGRALFPELREDVVPYMFPLRIDDPESKFRVLKERGMPMYRWEDCGKSGCKVSADYSRSLIQLPCHEQLRDDEIKFIADVLLASL